MSWFMLDRRGPMRIEPPDFLRPRQASSSNVECSSNFSAHLISRFMGEFGGYCFQFVPNFLERTHKLTEPIDFGRYLEWSNRTAKADISSEVARSTMYC